MYLGDCYIYSILILIASYKRLLSLIGSCLCELLRQELIFSFNLRVCNNNIGESLTKFPFFLEEVL